MSGFTKKMEHFTIFSREALSPEAISGESLSLVKKPIDILSTGILQGCIIDAYGFSIRYRTQNQEYALTEGELLCARSERLRVHIDRWQTFDPDSVADLRLCLAKVNGGSIIFELGRTQIFRIAIVEIADEYFDRFGGGK